MSTLDNDYRDGVVLSLLGQVFQSKVNTLNDLMHVRVSPFGDSVYRSIDDRLFFNGLLHNNGRLVWTTGPACFDYRDGSFLVCYADDKGWLSRFNRAGAFVERFQTSAPWEAPSEGLHHVEPGGRIVFGNDPSLIRTVKPGEEAWAGCVETESYIVGAYGQGQLAYFHKPTGVIKRWLGHTQSPHFALETAAGELYVFINGAPNTPEPNAVPWVETPAQPPVIVPPPVSSTNDIFLPLPLTPFPPAWVMMTCFDSPKVTPRRPGNAQHGVSPSDADPSIPVKEGAPYESTMVGRDWLLVAFSTEANAGGETGLAQSIDMAKRHGCGVEIHMDDHTHRDPMMAYRSTCLADGVVPVPSAHAVLNVDDFKADARELSRLGPFDITVNFHCIDKDPDTFRALMQAVEQIHRECLPRCITFIHWQVAGPQMQAYAAEYARLTPTPVNRPHQASQSLPPVTPPVTPKPKRAEARQRTAGE